MNLLCLINILFYLPEPSNYSFNKSTSIQIELQFNINCLFYGRKSNNFESFSNSSEKHIKPSLC